MARRGGLKIPWGLAPCRFESCSRHSAFVLSVGLVFASAEPKSDLASEVVVPRTVRAQFARIRVQTPSWVAFGSVHCHVSLTTDVGAIKYGAPRAMVAPPNRIIRSPSGS